MSGPFSTTAGFAVTIGNWADMKGSNPGQHPKINPGTKEVRLPPGSPPMVGRSDPSPRVAAAIGGSCATATYRGPDRTSLYQICRLLQELFSDRVYGAGVGI
jgi:hypothetical protein